MVVVITGGMPEMVFEYVLKKHGMNPQKDINLIQNIDFANTSGAFVSGKSDYTVELVCLIHQQIKKILCHSTREFQDQL